MNKKTIGYLSVVGLMTFSSITFTACGGKQADNSNGADSSKVQSDGAANNADAANQQSADDWQGTTWMNGSECLQVEQTASNQILMVGRRLNDEGWGYVFDVKKTGADSWDMQGTDNLKKTTFSDNQGANVVAKDKDNYSWSKGKHWVRKDNVPGCSPLFLCYSDKGDLESIYWQSSEDWYEVAQEGIALLISGKYMAADGKVYQFNTDGTCVFGGKNGKYHIENRSEGAPGTCILIDNTTYCLNLNQDGMLIYEAVTSDEGFLMEGKFVASLTADKSNPRWMFLSKEPCNSFVMEAVGDKEAVVTMRNEIYARHGWRFNDAKLNKYFSSKSWYKPVASNSDVKLTELEQLNIAYLKNLEKSFEE